jgi:hypothetical protein
MELGSNPMARFTIGFEKIRGTEYASVEYVRHQGPDLYWVPATTSWWTRTQFWFEKDIGLVTVGASSYIASLEKLYELVTASWEKLKTSQPAAVWNPYNFKFVVVYASVPQAGPGPVPPVGSGPGKTDPRIARRLERDLRLAEVTRLYASAQISAAVRDARSASILAEYPDLN